MLRLCSAAVLLTLFLTGPLCAQEAATADQVKELLAKFQSERADAAKLFSPAELVAADELVTRSQTALKDGNLAAAARFVRDARWQLPFLPTGLPANVSRVLGVSRLRHGDRVNSLAYSPDNARLASASRDGSVKVWDLGNGREILTYRGHMTAEAESENTNPFKVPAVTFSPDGKTIATSSRRDIHVWDSTTGKLLHTLTGHTSPARGLAFGPDANTLISGADDRRVIIWDVAKGKPAHTFAEQAQRIEAVAIGGGGKLIATVNAAGELFIYPLTGAQKNTLLSVPVTDGGQIGFGVSFVADGGGVISAGGDSKAKLIAGPDPAGTNPGSGATVRSYTGHSDKINTIGVTRDGKLLVTGSQDKTVRVWDVTSGKQLFSFQGHPGAVTAVAVRPDGRQAASGSEDGSIRLWPLAATDEHRASTEATDSLWTVSVSPDGKRYAAAGADRMIRVYDLATGKLEKTLTGHKGAIPAIAFVSSSAVVSTSGDKLLKVWDIASGNTVDLAGHTSAVLAVASDESGKLIVSGSVDKSVRGWDLAGKTLWTWTGKSAVCAVAVRKDGQRVAVGTADGWLTILAPSGSGEPKVIGAVSAHGAGVAGVAYHPDNNRVATCGGDGMVRIWTLPDNAAPVPLTKMEVSARGGASTTAPITGVAFSGDGRLIAFAGADTVTRVWDVQTASEIRGFRGHSDWVTSVAFTPDSRALLSVGVDKAVRMFELARQESVSAPGHTQPIRCVAVSRDGKFAVTGSVDRTLRVWDLTTGKEVTTLTGNQDTVNTVGFGGENQVVAAGADQKVRWWSINPPKEIRTTPTGSAFFMAVSADGSRVVLVSAREGERQAVFEIFTGTGEPARVTDKDREITSGTIASDGTLGVIGGKDGVVRIWDLDKKDRIGGDWPLFVQGVVDLALTADKKTLIAIDSTGSVKVADIAKREAGPAIKAVTGDVAGLVVSPSGDRFATLSAAGEVRVWDLKGTEIRTWKLPTSPAAAAFTPDGKKLITGNADGTAYVLDLP